MKVAGIIAEYNPLHAGHVYQINETKRQTGADYIAVAMSGSFTQRGIPAFFDKYLRAEMALAAGADLVLELPVSVSTGSGEYFSKGAVALLNSLGVVTDLSFGSECGDLDVLKEMAKLLSDESDDFSKLLKTELASGKNYPLALSDVMSKLNPEYGRILSHPNNTLGIEYLKAISTLGSEIKPLTIKRIGADYNSPEINSDYPSATALRKLCTDHGFDKLIDKLPPEAADTLRRLSANYNAYIDSEDFSEVLFSKLIYADSLSSYADMTPELANRINNILVKTTPSFSKLAAELKTKQITQARIQRALLHVLLEIKADDLDYIKTSKNAPYIKILAMKKDASALLKVIRQNASAPIISRPARDVTQLSGRALKLYEQDNRAYDLYSLIWRRKYPDSKYSPRAEYMGAIVL